MSCKDVYNRLRAADEASALEIQAILSMTQPSAGQVYPHLRGYILSRFLLDKDVQTDNLKELVSASLSRELEISEGDLAATDLSDRCIAAPSAETRLALVMLKFEEALGIRVPVIDRVNADTVMDYAAVVSRCLNSRTE